MKVIPAARRTTATLGVAVLLAAGNVVFGRPTDLLTRLANGDRSPVDSGEPVVEVTSEEDVDLAIVGAVRTTAGSQQLVAWFRQIERLQRSSYVPMIRRFSDPPRIEDLSNLTLDDNDLEALRECRPESCDLKLSAAEMERLRAAAGRAGSQWRQSMQEAFRHVMLSRARDYLARGFAGAQPYEDHRRPVDLAGESALLLKGSILPGRHMAAVHEYLRGYPARRGERVESFMFWSKDVIGDAKPIVGITHVSIVSGVSATDPTVVVSVQVFATHYLTGSVSMISVVPTPDGSARYVVYARRVRADVFHGTFGGLIRRIVAKRIRNAGPAVLDGLRRKLEGGAPPSM